MVVLEEEEAEGAMGGRAECRVGCDDAWLGVAKASRDGSRVLMVAGDAGMRRDAWIICIDGFEELFK